MGLKFKLLAVHLPYHLKSGLSQRMQLGLYQNLEDMGERMPTVILLWS